MGRSVGEWQAEITQWGASKGWDKPALCELRGEIVEGAHVGPQGVNVEAVGMKLALVHSEVSEALEALRDGKLALWLDGEKPEGMSTELADTVIRILHLGGLLGLDIEHAMEVKMAYNQGRPYRHGGRLA